VLSTLAPPLISLRLTGTKGVAAEPATNPSAITALTRGLAAGGEAAFRQFHDRYFERLYRFLLVVARGSEDEAREALQQTLLRVLRYVRVFDSEEAFWSWLKVLARSAARDAGRKQQRYASLLQAFAARRGQQEQAPAPDENRQLRGALEESLSELSPLERRLLEGKYLEGDTVNQLAAETGLTEKAVESRLVRLRRELRERILQKLQML
jgi:RNA polymerase sigma-70 factor (ECF subfamily)